MYILTKEEGGRNKPLVPYMQVQMFSRTWDCPTYIGIVGKEMVMPGEDAK